MSKRLKTDADRKRRPDAWEIKLGLSDADLARVFGWARNLGYARARQLIQAELKLDPPGETAFADWYDYYARQEKASRLHKAIVDGREIRDLAKECGDVTEAMTTTLENEASAAILGGDPDRIKLLVSLALKARGGRRSDEALKLEVQKYQDAVKTSIEKGLDALQAELKGNATALKLYRQLRETVLASVKEVAA